MLTEQINNIQYDMSTFQAFQAENRSKQEEITLLRAQQAMQAEQLRRHTDDSSVTSAITEYFAGLQANAANTTTGSSYYTSGTNPNTPAVQTEKQQQLLQTAKGRSPTAYKHINDGKGKQFKRYCWKCGCNCAHSTRGCYELSEAQRQTFKDATFTKTMGGSTRFLERREKYQKDYGFDSL